MKHGLILVAEDDPMIQKILGRMIKRSGFEGEVIVFADALEALNHAQSVQGAVDLVLMDTNLHPQGDAAFFHQMKAIAPNTPIVASSGHGEEELKGSQHFAGCDLFMILSKPFGLQDVKALIQALS